MTHTLERVLPVVDAAGRCGIPVLLRGGSGIGKTRGLSRLAHERGEHLEVVTASLYDPTDFGGIPVVTDRNVELAPMPWVRRVVGAGRPACVLFDEINTAPQPTQAALLRVLLEGVSGDVALPDGTRVVAAMNHVEASTGGWHLPAAISNRFLHLDVGVDAEEWINGMLTGWSTTPDHLTCVEPTPASLAASLAAVTAFIGTRPDLLHNQPTDPVLAAEAWPSNRNWDWVTQILPAVPDTHDLPVIAVEGLVGREAADAFFTYVDEVALPDIDDVLADPSQVDWANEPAERVLAILTGVVTCASATPTTYHAAGEVLKAVLAAGRADIATSLVKPYLTRTPAGATRDTQLLAGFAPLLTLAGKIG